MISIIIPVYNQEEFIADAIESALDQTIPCEIIVIDDGSTDKSGQIADSYKGRGIKVIHQVNMGLPSARNTGLMNAKGDWIIPLDADDVLMPQCAERVKDAPGDILMWDFKEFGIRNEVLNLGVPTLESMKTANRLAYCSAYKREIAVAIGGYNPRMIWGWEDYDFWLTLMEKGAIISHINEVLFLYRTKKDSMITEANKHTPELTAQLIKNHPTLFI